MKTILMLLAVLVSLSFTAHAQDAPDPGPGKPGVQDGSCWKNNSGHEISVEVDPQLAGDQKITVTEGDKSGSGTGDPDKDGGCANSSKIVVGNETYQVKNGRMYWENDKGKMVAMNKTECDQEVINL